MFTKVLVAEDMEDINKGVYATLRELGIIEIEQVQYCDDALLRIKRATYDGSPFELLITDLSFVADHRTQRLSSGESLVQELKQSYPELRIIVYSIDNRLQKVRSLITESCVNAYVCKGRRGLRDLSDAIFMVYNNKRYVSQEVQNALRSNSTLEVDDYEIELLKHLSKGLSQDEISALFKTNNISPSSLSSIEKRLNKLRIQFNANNAIQLVAMMKDVGLI
jgi:DNA-binding NarL/FixJ family response regulator